MEQGLRVVRALQPATREFGYHLALGGGVLNKGESNKDLDLYFLPMGGFDANKKHNPDAMFEFLERIWGTGQELAASLTNKEKYGHVASFYKYAVQFQRWGGSNKDIRQRIDCFIF
jgi:hypothetical protein